MRTGRIVPLGISLKAPCCESALKSDQDGEETCVFMDYSLESGEEETGAAMWPAHLAISAPKVGRFEQVEATAAILGGIGSNT